MNIIRYGNRQNIISKPYNISVYDLSNILNRALNPKTSMQGMTFPSNYNDNCYHMLHLPYKFIFLLLKKKDLFKEIGDDVYVPFKGMQSKRYVVLHFCMLKCLHSYH